MTEDDLSLAFEKHMTRIMKLSKPFPTPLRSINWDDCLEPALQDMLKMLAAADAVLQTTSF